MSVRIRVKGGPDILGFETMEDLRKRQDQIMAAWAVDFIANTRKTLKSRKARSSGELDRSFSYNVATTDAALVGEIVIMFSEYGRFIDMRRLNWRNQRPVNEIEEWVETKGVNKFIQNYRKHNPGRKIPSGSQLINQVAWGIVRGKIKRQKTRRKSWYNKEGGKLIGRLKGQLLELYTEFGHQAILNTLKSQ